MAAERYKSTDHGLRDVLIEAYKRGFTVKSDFARKWADYIGMAASMGLLSTRLYGDVFSSEWRVTPNGLTALQALIENIGEPEEIIDQGTD